MTPLLLVPTFLVFVSSYLVWQLTKTKQALILHALLLSLTPWILVLVIKQPPLKTRASLVSTNERISANISHLTSGEFLFFQGDGRPAFGTGDHGTFLLSFLPLILIGSYDAIVKKDLNQKLPLWWLLGGLSVAVLLGNVAGLPAALWFLPALSVLATTGAAKAISIFFYKQAPVPLKALLLSNALLLLYESSRLYHVILIHKPLIN